MIDEWIDFGPDGEWDWEPEDDAAWEDIPDWGDEPGWSDVDVADLDEERRLSQLCSVSASR